MFDDLYIVGPMLIVIATMSFALGRFFFRGVDPNEPMNERLAMMHARAKHRSSMIIYGCLIALGVVTFAGLVDIRDSTISALVVQFLNTIKDLAMGPSLAYFPRDEPEKKRE